MTLSGSVCPWSQTLTILDHDRRRSPSSWYVVATRSHAERRARAALSKAGFGTFLPERRVETQHRRTKQWQEHVELVMPGYVLIEFPKIPDHEWFDRGARPTWGALRRCDGVVAPLGDLNDSGEVVPLPLPTRLVEEMVAAQANLEFDDTREAKRRRGHTKENALADLRIELEGTEVLVTDGPFRSFNAVVDEVESLTRIKVLVEIFGRLTPIWMEPGQVELCCRPTRLSPVARLAA